jgi:signal transduction histidine kinase
MIFRVTIKEYPHWRLVWLSFATGSLLSVTAHAHAMEALATRHFYIGIAVLLLLQTTLIAILMIQNHRHRRAQDAAQQQQLEVTHAARLVLVGEMTASIAHEVSQPLSAILSNADAAEMLLQADPVPLDEIRNILDDIRRDDLRAHEIVRNLRKLLSRRELRMERIDINEIARTALSLSRSDAMRRGIVIRTALGDGLPMASGDPVHLQQVMLNLIINAMDSLKEAPANERHIEVQTRRHGARSVEVSVVDTGSGIPGDHFSRVFDSFYTTKQDGMGLGLSIARAIVPTHGGTIWAENNRIGRGANFRFTIPVAA